MSLGSALARARRAAEALMTSAAKVTRVTGQTTSATGVVTPTTSTLYTGRAYRQSYNRQSSTHGSAGHTFTFQGNSASFPVGAFEPQVGDVIEWVTVPDDPDLEGTKDRIVIAFHKSRATAMRLPVEELGN